MNPNDVNPEADEPAPERSDTPAPLWESQQPGPESPAAPLSAQPPAVGQVYTAELVEATPPVRPYRSRRRRRVLPLALFLLTCVSTFFAGATMWFPAALIGRPSSISDDGFMLLRQSILAHWQDGLLYTGCVLAILLTHEMGHFIATLRYRIPASFPYFLPFPLSPLGTLGAVIGMDGMRANRKEIFDIGIAGPLAGLVVAIPILCLGVMQLDLQSPVYGVFKLDNPLFVRALLAAFHQGEALPSIVWQSQLNPYYMAGWVGLFVTGLNMMPVSQLDGGHVVYALFGKKAHWIARVFILVALAAIFLGVVYVGLWLMLFLIMLVGTDHPPTSDDTVELGWFRKALGICSLSIPFLCFAPRLIIHD